MAKLIMSVQGNDGQIELLDDRVVINRKGLWSAMKFGLNASREFPLSSIIEVAYKPASIQLGEIEFICSGQAPVISIGKKKRKPVKPGAVQFSRKKNQEMKQFKEKVFEMINAFHNRHKS